MKISREDWGTHQNETIELIKCLDEDTGFEVHFITLGAAINVVKMPDKDGVIDDIHYGRASLEELLEVGGYQGAIVGRVASLIAFGRFELDGTIYELSKNMLGVHSQHGGKSGFTMKNWIVKQAKNESGAARIIFSYHSRDGEEGFPGNLDVDVIYVVKPMEISWEIKARTDKPTIVNMTNHAYWNLDGLYRSIEDLELQVNAIKFLKINMRKLIIKSLSEILRLGKRKRAPMELVSIRDLKIDLSSPKKISTVFQDFGNIDHNFIVKNENDNENTLISTLRSPTRGRLLEVWSTEPNVLIYTGNSMGGLKSFGRKLKKHQGICLESMKTTNSIQIPEIRGWVILRPEESYETKTTLKFKIDEKI